MKIKLNSDDKLPVNKMIEIPIITIIVRAVFLKNNKQYPHVLLDECLYKIQMKNKMNRKKLILKIMCVIIFMMKLMVQKSILVIFY